MQARHPGSIWLPAHCPDRDAAIRTTQGLNVLATPEDLDSVLDALCTTPDVDGIDRRSKETLALSGA
jgi:hypothetical protein